LPHARWALAITTHEEKSMAVARWPRFRRQLVPVAAGVAALALAVSGCTPRANAAKRPVVHHTPAPPAVLTVLPAGGTHVRPDRGVTVTAVNGKITNVTVRDGSRSAQGTLSTDGTVWRTGFALAPGTRYTVNAAAVNKDGKLVTATSSFTTFAPATVMTPSTNVSGGDVVGVGEPLIVQFDHPVSGAASKAAVERSLVLTTSVPVTGAWSWFGSEEVDFRPQAYWPAHTRISLDFHAAGLRASDGAYATQNLRLTYSIGDSQVTVVNTKTYRLHYYLNGKLLWNWPESSGMHEIDPATGQYFDTETGTFVVLYKKNPEIMSSRTVGITSGPFYYPPTPVYYAVKFTPSGNYVHDAPWSVGNQGNSNVSHGCVNISPGHAPLYYARAQAGDIVIIKNSPVPATPDDVTDWMYSWPHWLSHSATGAFTTGLHG
jgi:lipoprotein-anchoring transpeptidase ErfK/SrfK